MCLRRCQVDHLSSRQWATCLHANTGAYCIARNVQPWQISFKFTLTTISDMLPVLGAISNADELCDVLLRCCLQHAVGNRPDRYEPRVLKRRQKNYKLIQKPRGDYKPGEA